MEPTEPRYKMFTEIFYDEEWGTITGQRWVSALESIASGLGYAGWEYTIDYYYGKTPEEVVTSQKETEAYLREYKLEGCPVR